MSQKLLRFKKPSNWSNVVTKLLVSLVAEWIHANFQNLMDWYQLEQKSDPLPKCQIYEKWVFGTTWFVLVMFLPLKSLVLSKAP